MVVHRRAVERSPIPWARYSQRQKTNDPGMSPHLHRGLALRVHLLDNVKTWAVCGLVTRNLAPCTCSPCRMPTYSWPQRAEGSTLVASGATFSRNSTVFNNVRAMCLPTTDPYWSATPTDSNPPSTTWQDATKEERHWQRSNGCKASSKSLRDTLPESSSQRSESLPSRWCEAHLRAIYSEVCTVLKDSWQRSFKDAIHYSEHTKWRTIIAMYDIRFGTECRLRGSIWPRRKKNKKPRIMW